MDNVPLLDANQAEATAPGFIFRDHIKDTRKDSHLDIRPSKLEQDCSLSYLHSFSLKEFGPIHSLQRLEQEFQWIIDNKNAGYTKDHGLTPISSNGTHCLLVLEPCSCENLNLDYSGEVCPLVLSLFDQPKASFPSDLKPKGLPNEIVNWKILTDFILFFSFFFFFQTHTGRCRDILCYKGDTIPFQILCCVYAGILGTFCHASNTCPQ